MHRVSSSLIMVKSKAVLIDGLGSLDVVWVLTSQEDPEKPNFYYPLNPPYENWGPQLACQYCLIYPQEVPLFLHKLETHVWIASWIWWPINYENTHCLFSILICYCTNSKVTSYFYSPKKDYTYPCILCQCRHLFFFSRNVSKATSFFL